jgi:hypothetical protein
MSAAAATAPLVRRPARRALLLLVAVTALPFVAAWLLYFNPQWLPAPQAQHGTLLEPPRPVSELALRTLDGNPLALPRLGADDWLLLTVEPGTCAIPCRERQVRLRQARRAAGIEKDRVVRILALANVPDPETRERLRIESPDLTLAQADPELLALAGDDPALLLGDPRGDLVLRYPGSVPTKDVLKDLKRLLRVSRSW